MSHYPPIEYTALQFSDIPVAPAANSPIHVTYDTVEHCFQGFVTTTADIPARSIVIRVGGNDTGFFPCPAAAVTPATTIIPPLPRGLYQLEKILCPPLPIPGTPECYVFASQSLFVGGGEPASVPALSPLTAALTAALLLAAAIGRR